MSGRFDGQPVYRPGVGRPKTFDGVVQDIAAAGHARGIVLMKADTVVGSLEAADLCRALRAAHENTRGNEAKHDHVERLAFGIGTRLGVKGAVQVARFAWNLIQGYAAARKFKGGNANG